MEDKILKKILEIDDDTYIIFFDYGCRYSEGALDLLRKSDVKYKGYQIVDIEGGLTYLINVLKKHANDIDFTSDHNTKPVIFFNKKFIGGFTELDKLINTHQN